MDSQYETSSILTRFLAAVAASVVTGSLFGAVAFGLTGDGDWSLFAQGVDTVAPVQATATA